MRFSVELLEKKSGISLEQFVAEREEKQAVWHYTHTDTILPSGIQAIKQTWTHQLSGLNYFILLADDKVICFKGVKPDTLIYKGEIPYFQQMLFTFRFLK